MGKFFDAMQRAAKENGDSENRRPAPAASLPELDETLLEPEQPVSDVFGAPDTSKEVSSTRSEKNTDSPSAVIRTLESDLVSAKVAVQKPKDPTPQLRPPIHVVGPESVRAPSLRHTALDTTREPVATVVRVHPAYDRIVQRLKTYRRTHRQSVILIAAAVAGEGSSTVARNVATAMSQAGTEGILLMDGNLRTPSQHTAFGVAREGGFSDVLKGEASLTSVIHDDVGSGISLISCGSRVKSPSQVMTASAVEGVTVALLSLYDWIIIDGSPATVYPDVATIGTACGGAILVVRAESTRSEVAEEAKEVLEGTGAEVLGAVLNRRRFHIPNAIYRRL